MVPAGDELHEGGLAVEPRAVAGRAAAVGRVTTVVASGMAVVRILGVAGFTVAPVVARSIVTATRVSASIAGVTVPSITAIVTITPTITVAILATTIHPRSNGRAPIGSSNGSAHLLEGARRLDARAGKPSFRRLHAVVVDQGPRKTRALVE